MPVDIEMMYGERCSLLNGCQPHMFTFLAHETVISPWALF